MEREQSAEHAWLEWLVPSLGSLVAVLALWLALGPAAAQFFGTDGDVGRHIRVGSHILESGSIPHTDLFSHTMRGAPFVPYEWLSEVLFAGVHEALGLAGVALLTALLFSATCTLVYWIAVREGVSRPLALLAAGYSLYLQSIHLLARPHLFTTLLAAVWLALLLEYRRSGKERFLWALPPVMVLWANLHGGFLIGFILLVLFLADAARQALLAGFPDAWVHLRRLGIAAAVSLVASCLNPVGYELLLHTTGYLRLTYAADNIVEYLSPNFHHLNGMLLLGGILFAFGLLALGRARVRFLEAELCIVWLAAALYSTRNIPLFAVLVVPALARWLQETLERSAANTRSTVGRASDALLKWGEEISSADVRWSKPLAPALLLSAVVVVSLAGGSERFTFSERTFPVRALEAAREGGVAGKVFNEDFWGGFLLYEAYPEVPVFIDGQFDFYGEKLMRDYLKVRRLMPGWEEPLESHGIDWTLTRTPAPLNAALAQSPAWHLFYQDSVATIYVRAGERAALPSSARGPGDPLAEKRR